MNPPRWIHALVIIGIFVACAVIVAEVAAIIIREIF
jgi:hypothetical protein